MKSWDIVAYTYRADTYCPSCVRKAVGDKYNMWNADSLDTEGFLDQISAEHNSYVGNSQIDRMDESTFDSGDFPKVVFADSIKSDEYCSSCHEIILEG